VPVRRSLLLSILLIGAAAAVGCEPMILGTQPFEPDGPLARVRPTRVRIVVPAASAKQNTNITSQESWTSMLALALAANGHEVAIGGPIPPALIDPSISRGPDFGKIYADRGDAELTIEVKGHAVELFGVDFPHGSRMGQALLTVEIRGSKESSGIIRNYIGHSVGYENVLIEAQQWCVWDLTHDPIVAGTLARVASN